MPDNNENSQITAIKMMGDLSHLMMSVVLAKVEEIHKGQENLARAIHEQGEIQRHLGRQVAELTAEVKRMTALMRSETADALTAPLMDLKAHSDRRKRERSGSRQIYGDTD